MTSPKLPTVELLARKARTDGALLGVARHLKKWPQGHRLSEDDFKAGLEEAQKSLDGVTLGHGPHTARVAAELKHAAHDKGAQVEAEALESSGVKAINYSVKANS